jgi:hypothetical protein
VGYVFQNRFLHDSLLLTIKFLLPTAMRLIQ